MFWKYHGLGNDFIVLENFDGRARKDPDFVRRLCDRRFGIGADGILYVERDDEGGRVHEGPELRRFGGGDVRQRHTMRGQAPLRLRHRSRKETMSIDTLAGIKDIECTVKGGLVTDGQGGDGRPAPGLRRCPDELPRPVRRRAAGRRWQSRSRARRSPWATPISSSSRSSERPRGAAPRAESSRRIPLFPRKTNVEFVKSKEGLLEVKVFERGAGWTHGLRHRRLRHRGGGGTAWAWSRSSKEIEVRLPGGSLWINGRERPGLGDRCGARRCGCSAESCRRVSTLHHSSTPIELKKIPPYLFAEIEEKVRKKQAQGVDIIDFGIGDPDLPTPRPIVEEIKRQLEDPENHRYPILGRRAGDAQGGGRLVQEALQRRARTRTARSRSSSAARRAWPTSARAFVNPGEKVLCPDPAYPVYAQGADAALRRRRRSRCPLQPEASFLLETWSSLPSDAKMLYLNYPNNPTGAVVTKDLPVEGHHAGASRPTPSSATTTPTRR